jgi:hypothetical protein
MLLASLALKVALAAVVIRLAIVLRDGRPRAPYFREQGQRDREQRELLEQKGWEPVCDPRTGRPLPGRFRRRVEP